MKRQKYPISKEFLPLSLYTPPALSRKSIDRANRLYRFPKSLYKDPSLNISMLKFPGYKGGEIELMLFRPVGIEKPAPCFYFIHGGGFVFEATSAHYRRAANLQAGTGFHVPLSAGGLLCGSCVAV